MRPFRLVCTVLFFFLVGFFILLSLVQPIPDDGDTSDRRQRENFRSRWSFGAPASLFPPSAVISLTDDNTTFFLARPALYGPLLPADGLSGQLWVGAGFGDDTLVRGGMITVGQAELGCSDIPGWSEERLQFPAPILDRAKSPEPKSRDTQKGSSKAEATRLRQSLPEEDDDTDNFLHYPLRGEPLLKSSRQEVTNSPSGHADIQSLQEGAAIAGKVVLLSRGGCGFLEKTKWVQRRGGVALIVGDYTRGGHLIQMSAHDDVSNVTIPSIFTAYTSAHLLASLIPSKSATNTIELEKTKKQLKNVLNRPAFTTTTAAVPPKATKTPAVAPVIKTMPKKVADKVLEPDSKSWLSTIASKIGLIRRGSDAKENARPPSSGTVSWVQSRDWDDESITQSSRKVAKKVNTADSGAGESDGIDDFIIGVHDWRDPDMIARPKDKSAVQQDSTEPVVKPKPAKESQKNDGSRTPESGVYEATEQKPGTKSPLSTKTSAATSSDVDDDSWLHGLLGTSSGRDDSSKDNQKAQDMYRSKIAPHFVQDQEFEDENRNNSPEREGLWITMTPTSVSASPFFDTLLVLVISPLVTLTVVYALLLLRARIRRRRWRAPRSVVDRLPVRTYQTMTNTSSTSTSHTTSPHLPSQNTPLLPSRPRPRSATVANIRQEASASLERATALLSSREKQHSPSNKEANNAFKRKYKGRQVECVVCLEEYIDGQSQVMSLPCGHEFHAECITPWLTMRRRVCPICKGDVVRSMDGTSTPSTASSSYTSLVLLNQEASSASPPPRASSPAFMTSIPSPIAQASDPLLQDSIALTRNDSPTSAIPIPTSSSSGAGSASGGERGDGEDLAATLVGSRQTGDGIFTPPAGTNSRRRERR